MTLYDELGVKPDATPDELHKAYRARAAQCHPDHHPEKEDEFKTLTRTYALLSSPGRRRQYDKTGKENTLTPEQSIKQQAFELIGSLFLSIVEGGTESIFREDIIKGIKATSINASKQYQEQIALANKGLKQWGRIRKRISFTGDGFNQMEYVCDQQIAQLEQKKAYAEEGIEVSAKLREMLRDYKWERDENMWNTSTRPQVWRDTP